MYELTVFDRIFYGSSINNSLNRKPKRLQDTRRVLYLREDFPKLKVFGFPDGFLLVWCCCCKSKDTVNTRLIFSFLA